MTRAAMYLRISQDQTGEALGVTRQREDCLELAASLGWQVVETYTDNDVSATSAKPRPAYRKLLADIQAGEIDAIVAWHADRLYRRMVDLIELLEVVRNAGTQVATVKAGRIDLTTDSGQMIAEILASVASYEGRAKATRWKRSIRQRREAGMPPRMGPRLFGYSRDGDVIPAERDAICEAVDELLAGTPVIRVAHNLNAAGHRTSQGNPWTRQSLVKLLRNGRLAGRSTLNGDTLAVGNWEPIIAEEAFEELQGILSARRGTVPQRPRVALLLGLVICGKCGHKMVTGRRARRGEGEPVRIYRCSTMPGDGGCGGMGVDAEAVEEVVEAYARRRLTDPRVMENIERLQSSGATNITEALGLEDRLRELEAELDQPGVPVAAILRAMDRARERLAEIHSAPTALPTGSLRGEWPADLARRARLVRLVVGQVTINPARYSGRFDPERVVIEEC